MTQPYRRQPDIDGLSANRSIVSAHKYGFFLCRAGTARILLGSKVYRIARNNLCIYTPNTFLQIIERSDDLQGVLEEDVVDAYYPVVSSVDIRKRLQMRNSPCVEVSERQADGIVRLVDVINDEAGCTESGAVHDNCLRHLRYALCLKVLDVYFCNTPVEAVPQSRDETILNRFLMSVHDNCHRQRTVQYYAAEQNLSPYYFSSIVKAGSGKSALQWIESITMTFARQYLICSDMSIKEIADRLNFPDQSTFGRYFKQREGCSPSEFREKRLKKWFINPQSKCL